MPAADKIDAILARFPGPVTMPVSRLKAAGVLLGSLAFVAIGILILRYGDGEADEIFWAWAGIIFFGLCAAVAAVMLLPGAGSLTLAADGFAMCSLFRKVHTPWRQASDFTVGTWGGQGTTHSLVAYEDARATGFAADTSRSLVGRSASLPDTYGLKHEQLARLLTLWRARAGRDAGNAAARVGSARRRAPYSALMLASRMMRPYSSLCLRIWVANASPQMPTG